MSGDQKFFLILLALVLASMTTCGVTSIVHDKPAVSLTMEKP